MPFPIFKSRDARNIRVYADEVRPGVWAFTRHEGDKPPTVLELSGEKAETEMTAYRNADHLSFFSYYSGGMRA